MRWIVPAVIVLGAGCAGLRWGPKPPPPPMPVKVVEAPKKAAAPAPSAAVLPARPAADVTPVDPRCGSSRIVGLQRLLMPGRMFLLGERPGSNEIPAFAGDAACEAAALGYVVHLMLEIPRAEQRRLDAYLASAGAPEDRQRFLEGRMWHRIYEDGRSSVAVLALIDRVHALRAEGLTIQLHYYDEVSGPYRGRLALKERAVATNILEVFLGAPEDVFFVLTGNAHAWTAPKVPWDPELQPMGYHLKQRVPQLLSLDADFPGGQAWMCKLSPLGKYVRCGPKYVEVSAYRMREEDVPRGPDGKPVSRFMGTWPEPTPEGFDGIFHVGPLTPAPPAARSVATR